MQFPITIGLHRSHFMGRALLATALVAIATVTGLPRSTAIFAIFSLSIAGLYGLARHRLAQVVTDLRLEPEGRLSVRYGGRSAFTAVRLLPGALVHPWLTVFRFEDEAGQRASVVLVPDSLLPDDFRRLRVFLRWRSAFSECADDV